MMLALLAFMGWPAFATGSGFVLAFAAVVAHEYLRGLTIEALQTDKTTMAAKLLSMGKTLN